MTRMSRFVSYLQGLSPDEKRVLAFVKTHKGKDAAENLKYQLRDKTARVELKNSSIAGHPFVLTIVKGRGFEELNALFAEDTYRTIFQTFAPQAFLSISTSIAPNIYGKDHVKQAACLQLFAQDRLHILLLGDPGTGKTDILRSTAAFADVSSFGLGSGTTGVGLSVTYARGELHKGILVKADKGLCCIDELNLMKKDDRAALYNAMEKGFVTYTKGGRDETFSADVRILATANPTKDRFTGTTIKQLKKQIPFDAALLSRFHIVFIIRKPDVEEFVTIAKSVIRAEKKRDADATFFRNYIIEARKIEVEFPDKLESLVTEAAKKVKQQENNLLTEVSPRLVKGIVGFAKASARCEMRSMVEEKDVERALKIFSESLGIQL